MNVHVIAEAGSNHNGDADRARRLVEAAAAAGADSVKVQFIYPEGLYLPRFPVETGGYVENHVFAARQAEVMPDDVWRDLAAHARACGIPFSASAFDRRGIALLVDIDAAYIKIASTDLTNGGLIALAAETGRPVVLSTGMSELGDIEKAVAVVARHGSLERLVLLHCVSVYPCPVEISNIGMIETLRRAFGCAVGFSDHTDHGALAAVLAVAQGATWIEKHVTTDRALPGFDHRHAFEPDEFGRYVQDIRLAALALERPVAKIDPREAVTMLRARRSLYAARDLAAGEMIGPDDVLVVRPAGPLRPEDIGRVVGQRTTKAIRRYQAFALDAGIVGADGDAWRQAADYWSREMAEKGMADKG